MSTEYAISIIPTDKIQRMGRSNVFTGVHLFTLGVGVPHLYPIVLPVVPCPFQEIPPSPLHNTSTGHRSLLGVTHSGHRSYQGDPAQGPYLGMGYHLPGNGYHMSGTGVLPTWEWGIPSGTGVLPPGTGVPIPTLDWGYPLPGTGVTSREDRTWTGYTVVSMPLAFHAGGLFCF